MSRTRDTSNGPRRQYLLLAPILALFALLSIVGIDWGLPTARNDKYLFSGEPPWPGEKIYRLAGAAEKLGDASRAADVDVDPLDKSGDEPILLNGTDEQIAAIYLRYRLYTHQPDEMITMMALAGMRPSRLELDPKLYQYGGLFIYPVGALLKLCGLLGLIDVRSDVVWYLDHPDEFGKFYIVSRAYSAAWGMVGVVIVFAIARRLGGWRAGLLAALLFTTMPVVICMAHEGKPHLPGAVLMLAAVWFAMRHREGEAPAEPIADYGLRIADSRREGEAPAEPLDAAGWHGSVYSRTRGRRDWWMMCACCGAALGMVLSSLPIFVLIPLVAWKSRHFDISKSRHQKGGSTSGCRSVEMSKCRLFALGVLAVLAVYVLTNPYVVINAIVPSRREILASNFGNSLAMYEVSRVVEGFVRVIELTIEGAGLPIVVFGALAIMMMIIDGRRRFGAEIGWHGSAYPQTRGVDAKTITKARKDESTKEDSIVSGGTAPSTGPRVHGTVPPGWDVNLKSQISNWNSAIPLLVSAAVFFLQFVLIGAGKPAEYGRFGIFTNTALAIATACLFTQRRTRLREMVNWIPASMVVCWVGLMGWYYEANLILDSYGWGTRPSLSWSSAEGRKENASFRNPIAVISEPAPYCCPPIDFQTIRVYLYSSMEEALTRTFSGSEASLILPYDAEESLPVRIQHAPVAYITTGVACDDGSIPTAARLVESLRRLPRGYLLLRETPISWADKPLVIFDLRNGQATHYVP